MIKLKNYPKGRKWSYSTDEIGQRAERLTADILQKRNYHNMLGVILP